MSILIQMPVLLVVVGLFGGRYMRPWFREGASRTLSSSGRVSQLGCNQYIYIKVVVRVVISNRLYKASLKYSLTSVARERSRGRVRVSGEIPWGLPRGDDHWPEAEMEPWSNAFSPRDFWKKRSLIRRLGSNQSPSSISEHCEALRDSTLINWMAER